MKRMLAAVIGVGLIVGSAIRPAPLVGQAANLCYMPQSGAYSVGAVETRGGELYRCSLIFDQNLQPAGVAWIKMAQQTVYVPKPGL